MANTQWILLEEETGYRIATVNARGTTFREVPAAPEASPEELAAATAKALEENGYRGGMLSVALGPKSCLAATIPHEGRSMTRDRKMMTFASEEHLPLAAEEMVADFVVFPEEALAVSVEVAQIGPLVDALEKAELPVQSVAPLPLLALQQQMNGVAAKERLVVVWQHEDALEFFEVTGGRPRSWKTLPADPGVLVRELQLLALTGQEEFHVQAYSLDRPLLDAVRALPEVRDLSADSIPMAEAAAAVAARQLRGHVQGWIELCRSPIGSRDPYRPVRGALRAVTLAAAILCLLVSAGFWWRSHRYQQLTGQYRQAQREAFQQALPGRPVPVGILSRLEGEHEQLSGLTARTGDLPQRRSALRHLHDVLLALPSDLRYRVLEIHLQPEQVDLEGEARHHGDADLLAAALREVGYDVDPPHTQQLPTEGVSWQIAASIRADHDSPSQEEGSR